MPKKTTLNAGSPVYASTFIDNTTFAVGGGGGQGAHGVKNKILVYKTKPKVEEIAAMDLKDGSDSVTSISCTDSRTLNVGVNLPNKDEISRLLQIPIGKDGKMGTNVHLLQSKGDISVYQRSVRSYGEVTVVTNSSNPAKMNLISPKSTTEVEINDEVLDLSLNEDVLAILSGPQIDLRHIETPNASFVVLKAPEKHQWGHIAYLGKGEFAASSVYGNRVSAYITVFSVNPKSDKLVDVKRTFKLSDFKGVTALTASGFVIAAANANGDVVLYNSFTESQIRSFKNLHKLPVTSLSLSSDRDTVVSTSMDGSVIVTRDLHGGVSKFSVFMLFLAVAALIGSVVLFIIKDAQENIAATATQMPEHIKVPEQTPTPTSIHTHHPGVVSVDLHAGHGMGHGPVVQSLNEHPNDITLAAPSDQTEQLKTVQTVQIVETPDAVEAVGPTEVTQATPSSTEAPDAVEAEHVDAAESINADAQESIIAESSAEEPVESQIIEPESVHSVVEPSQPVEGIEQEEQAAPVEPLQPSDSVEYVVAGEHVETAEHPNHATPIANEDESQHVENFFQSEGEPLAQTIVERDADTTEQVAEPVEQVAEPVENAEPQHAEPQHAEPQPAEPIEAIGDEVQHKEPGSTPVESHDEL